jgi:endonuclease/exonuclease/phosphatase (EEP) superfamily protein YafD
LTYNVEFSGHGDPTTLAAIRASGAQVVFLQETNPAWEDAARAGLSDLYPFQAFRHAGIAGGQGVLSRWPFEERTWVPGAWFPAWVLELSTPLGTVQALNVHLRPPLTGSGPLRGYWSNRAFREKEMERFAAQLAPGEATLVVGDFNEPHEGRAVALLESRGYRDALPLFPTAQDTWHWPTRLVTLHGQLDHLMGSRELVAVEAEVRHLGNSDHYPVLASFQLRRPTYFRG